MAKKKNTSSNLLEVQNAAKTLFANIRFQSVDKPIHSLLLTSSVPDEGKTTTAWYLAQAIATSGNRVLLIEADMRRRSLANMLQLHSEHGLFAVLSGSCALDEAVVPTTVRNLDFLDAEPSIPNPADLLASKRMVEFIDQLLDVYDYVLFDTPPVGTFVDAAILGTIVDASILVVRQGKAKRSELQLAYEQMSNAGANVIGLCATFVEGTGSEYYYSYYTKGDSKGEEEEESLASETPSAEEVSRITAEASSQAGGVRSVPRSGGAAGRSVPRSSRRSAAGNAPDGANAAANANRPARSQGQHSR